MLQERKRLWRRDFSVNAKQNYLSGNLNPEEKFEAAQTEAVNVYEDLVNNLSEVFNDVDEKSVKEIGRVVVERKKTFDDTR